MSEENKSNKIITIALVAVICIAAVAVIYVSLPTNNENNEPEGGGNQQTESIVLTVIYGDEQIEYTFGELRNLTSYTGKGGYRTSFPSIKGQGNYTGVTITKLVELSAGDIENYSIIVTSTDGNKTFNYSYVMGNVDIYNSTNASDATPIGNGGLTMVLAYKYEEEYLDVTKDGKLKTVFLDEDGSITSSGLWWKYVFSIEIVR